MNGRDLELVHLCAWLARQPANGDGADKRFVVAGAQRLRRLAWMPRFLTGIGPRGAPGSITFPAPPPEALVATPVSQPIDETLEVCLAFERAGLRYLVIGAFGIHLYALRGGVAIPTEDCDVLLPQDPATLGVALGVLTRGGFELEAGGEPLVDPDDVIVAGLLRARAVVHATRGDTRFDLVLHAADLPFEPLWLAHRRFTVEGGQIHVAPLEALLRSKLAAGRVKDLLFLERFRELIEELQQRERRSAPG